MKSKHSCDGTEENRKDLNIPDSARDKFPDCAAAAISLLAPGV